MQHSIQPLFPLAALFATSTLLGSAPCLAQEPTRRISGGEYGLFGSAVAAVGDVDGDGITDHAIGAERVPPAMRGRLRIHSGATGDILLEVAPTESRIKGFGFSVAGVGDVSGDGIGDVLVGAPWSGSSSFANDQAGHARLVSGADGATLLEWDGAGGDRFGFDVAACGDLDGDGLGDLLVSEFVGTVRAYSSADGTALLTLSSSDGVFGHSVAGAVDAAGAGNGGPLFDVDQDGTCDILVGDPFADPSAVRVYSGADGTLLREHLMDVWLRLGYSVAVVGDVDLDGHVDYVAGAPGWWDGSSAVGRAFLFSGADGATLVEYANPTPDDQDYHGAAVAGVGDVQGDGRPDVLVGAYYDLHPSLSGVRGGSATLYSGADGGVLHTFRGTQDGGEFGWSVGAAGDLNGDGLADLLVGARQEDGGMGAVYVYDLEQGTPYCPSSQLNSTGLPGELSGHGSVLAAHDRLELVASQMAPESIAILALSPGNGGPMLPRPNLELCIGPKVARVTQGTGVAGPDGRVVFPVGLTDVPVWSSIEAGETWHFQALYLEKGDELRTTNALRLQFD